MTQRILDHNPLSGMTVTFQYNDATDQIVIGHHQDASPVIEDNKWALQDLDSHKKAAKNDWAHYAKIPEIVILEWKALYGVDFMDPNHWTKCMSLLNSPEYKHLKRTSYHHDR
jgi:hypothetical protein